MKKLFRYPVGLSDHTLGVGVSIAGVAAGAQVIEKHFTLSRKIKTLDSFFSIEPQELKDLVESVLGETETRYVSRRRRKPKKLPISSIGFDLDQYLEQFENAESERTQFKALVEMSKRINAISVVVLGNGENELKSSLTLGLSEKSVEKFRFQMDDPLAQDIYTKKQTLGFR